MIEAKYVTKGGDERTSILLLSGWWGLARWVELYLLFVCKILLDI